MKCGICHTNTMANSVQPPSDGDPCAAVQPMSGGSAPGTAPTSVEIGERRFIGV
jgi:hypothetical protein